jgi:serine/threonine-protein kinase HipA
VDGVAKGPAVTVIVGLLRAHARPSIEQVQDFLTLFWFNIAIGNVDAHSKNYSLLYTRDMRSFRIAPLYDAICVSAFHAHHERSKRVDEEPLSMNIGGRTRFWQLENDDIVRFAQSLNIGPGYAMRQIAKAVDAIDDAVDDRIDANQSHSVTQHPILDTVRDELHGRCEFLRHVVTR